ADRVTDFPDSLLVSAFVSDMFTPPLFVCLTWSSAEAVQSVSTTYNRLADDLANAADAESGPRVLGGLGRLDVRRDGLVHLRARPRPRTRRALAALGHRRHSRQHRFLRQRALRALPRGLGSFHAMGTPGRPL